MTVSPTAVRTLQKAIGEWKAKTVSPSIVYGGREENKIQDCRIVPWEKLGRKLFENIV